MERRKDYISGTMVCDEASRFLKTQVDAGMVAAAMTQTQGGN